jgi:hypothetical protein
LKNTITCRPRTGNRARTAVQWEYQHIMYFKCWYKICSILADGTGNDVCQVIQSMNFELYSPVHQKIVLFQPKISLGLYAIITIRIQKRLGWKPLPMLKHLWDD